MKYILLIPLFLTGCSSTGGYTLGITLGYEGISAGINYSAPKKQPVPEPVLVVSQK